MLKSYWMGVGLLSILLMNTAAADCVCRCVNGDSVPLCTSTLDIRPICSPRICPTAPPSIEPIRAPSLPPLGTKQCTQQQVLNPFSNKYEWRTVCQ
jgi:hypothetical protein